MHSYRAFGLRIDSKWRLPECRTADGPPDLLIRQASVSGDGLQPVTDSWSIAVDDAVRLRHHAVGSFRLATDTEIDVDPAASTTEPVLRHYLLGPVLGVMLHLRGSLVLHASAIRVEGSAIAFVGGTGSGKSLIAATAYRRGHPPLTDDIAAVTVDDSPHLEPGPAILKLDAEGPIASDFEDTRLERPELPKDYYRFERDHPDDAVPLDHVFVLEPGNPPRIESIDPQTAVMELVRTTYVSPLLKALGDRERNLTQCGQLADAVPPMRVSTGRYPSDLDEVLNRVERTVSHVG